MKKYNLTYQFFDTEEQAQAFCDRENASGTAWKRAKHKAHFTLWRSMNGKENKFIAWYVW